MVAIGNTGFRFAVLALIACICSSTQSELRVTPIQKVIKLLNELLVKAKKAKGTEAVEFAKFSQWCKDQSVAKDLEIVEGKQKIKKFGAEIEKAAVLIKSTDGRIKELEEDVGRWEKDQKSASDVRSMEKADYVSTLTDYQESLEALGGAIATLKKQDFTRKQASALQESLLQVQSRHRSAPVMPAELRKTLTALAQESDSDSDADSDSDSDTSSSSSASSSTASDSLTDSVSSSLAASTEALTQLNDDDAKPAAGYEFQSGGVIDMLNKLKDQFSDEKANLEKEELQAQLAYEAIMQQLADNLKGAKSEIATKKSVFAKTEQAKAEKEGSKKASEKELDEDTNYLKDTTEMCQLKTSDFKSRQKLREDESTSLTQALEIMGSDAVKGAGEKHLPSLMQLSSKSRHGTVFAHLRSDTQTQNPVQGKLAVFFNERARSIGSTLLLDVAQRVGAGDPFDKVRKMVKDLMIKLMEEQTAETEHKGWCDTEMTTNEQTREKKTEDADVLNSDIEDLTAAVAKLSQENSDLTQAIKELDQAMIDATKEREKSKATNMKTIKDAKAAISAVEQAIAVLKDFYAKSAEATAFAQAGMKAPEDDAPETFDKPFKGHESEGGSIIGFLEVILSDFTRLDSETTASEAQELEEYKNFMFEAARDRALKAGEINIKDGERTEKESSLHSAKVDLKSTEGALDKAIKYYEKLKPDCSDKGLSYAERQKKRQEEIQSLQEALKMLTEMDSF